MKLTMLNNTKLRHFWAQIVSWAPRHARKTFIVLAPDVYILDLNPYRLSTRMCICMLLQSPALTVLYYCFQQSQKVKLSPYWQLYVPVLNRATWSYCNHIEPLITTKFDNVYANTTCVNHICFHILQTIRRRTPSSQRDDKPTQEISRRIRTSVKIDRDLEERNRALEEQSAGIIVIILCNTFMLLPSSAIGREIYSGKALWFGKHAFKQSNDFVFVMTSVIFWTKRIHKFSIFRAGQFFAYHSLDVCVLSRSRDDLDSQKRSEKYSWL